MNGSHSEGFLFITANVSDNLLAVEISLSNRYEEECQC
jgi:hypothetical protein